MMWTRRRSWWLMALGAVGVMTGVWMPRLNLPMDATALAEERLWGTWELQTVGDVPIGPEGEAGIVSQQMTFSHGTIQGETRLLASSAAGSTEMPFPDLSVSKVEENTESTGNNEVRVCWDGTYTILPNNRLEFRIGKAQYKVAAKFDPATHALEMESDTILTYKGTARYRTTTELARR